MGLMLAFLLLRAPPATHVEVGQALEVYAAQLRAEDWEGAWSGTSASYKQGTSSIVFMTGQVRNAEAWGVVERFEVLPNEPETYREGGTEVLRFDVVRHGRNMRASAMFDFVETGGHWEIRRTWWVHPPTPATERVF